uniref:Uncharacterized protein n=1 Tax=Anguilla anguilla TaxID=7936 RepID=A0A0E9VX63_ANGAN
MFPWLTRNTLSKRKTKNRQGCKCLAR